MEVHSLTYIYDYSENSQNSEKIISKLYLQFDGYPSGIGSDFADYLKNNGKRVNIDILADNFVKHFFNQQKDWAMIYPPFDSEEWVYHIYPDKIKIVHDDNVYFADWRNESFSQLCETLEETEKEEEKKYLETLILLARKIKVF